MPAGLYIGLMSGTSMDGIDAVLAHCDNDHVTVVASHGHPLPDLTRDLIHQLSHPGADEIEALGRLDRALGRLFAEAALAVVKRADVAPSGVRAIGSHGQTLRHRPPSNVPAAEAFSLQVGDPNTIAEITGITTVADFRRRDVAAGGEGAPLAPAFHAAVFGEPGRNRAVANIGGIANVSLLQGTNLATGFDCGPGNTLLDQWIARHQDQRYDRDGNWARSGQVPEPLLQALLAHPYLHLSGPRSTGKEAFNLEWLDSVLAGLPRIAPEDVQAALAQFTAECLARALERASLAVETLYLCGGGAHNSDLRERIARRLPAVQVTTTDSLGIGPDWVEGALFAWLAYRSIAGLPGNAVAVTGASGPRILGGIFPGS